MKNYNFEIDFKSKNFNNFPFNKIDEREKELLLKIEKRKKELKDEMVILSHHYQNSWIVSLGDYIGDSFQLSKIASEKSAPKIVFAGVHFMAESAEILSKDDQTVYLPNLKAGCPMADMATKDQVTEVWDQLSEVLDMDKVIPITYMNSSAEIKAFCGEHNGAVCTSSNAEKIMEWGYKNGDKILFIPDKNLGRNSATNLGIDKSKQIIYDINKPLGGYSEDVIKDSKIILWPGYCHVHTHFIPNMVDKLDQKYKNYKLIVHPESDPEVVKRADASGSTKLIVDYVEASSPGDTIVIGTEINLVDRLAKQYSDRTIIPLSRSLCPNMYRISIESIYDIVTNFPEKNIITVPKEIKKYATIALENMLRYGK